VAGQLDPEQVRRALAHPTIGPQLRGVGLEFRPTLSGGGFVICPPAQKELAAQLVALAHELPQQRAPLPGGLNWFAWSKIEKAVKAFANGTGRNDVAAETKLPPQDATRVKRMWEHELLRLNERGKLIVDPRVPQRRGRELALRYWDGASWLDPRTSLR
jgi:hypothetical protein